MTIDSKSVTQTRIKQYGLPIAIFSLLIAFSTQCLAETAFTLTNQIFGRLFMKPVPPAETFFEGKALELAKYIDMGDADKTFELASQLGKEQLNAYGHQGMTLLMYAGYKALPETKRQLAVITALIKAGADPEQESPPNDGSILSAAMLRARIGPEFLKAILDGGVNPNIKETKDSTQPLLFRVASQDTPASLRLLVEYGADVNARDSLGQTALFQAIKTFALDEINYLLDHGADPKVVNMLGHSFASYVYDEVQRQQSDPRYGKILAIRDRIIRAGVQWPPLSAKEMRQKMRSRGEKVIIPYGEKE